MNNLAADEAYADVIARMDKELKAWMAYCGDKGQKTEMQALEHQAHSKADKTAAKAQKGKAVAKDKKKSKNQSKK